MHGSHFSCNILLFSYSYYFSDVDYTYEQMKVGLNLPCTHWLFEHECKQLFEVIRDKVRLVAYVDPRLDGFALGKIAGLGRLRNGTTVARVWSHYRVLAKQLSHSRTLTHFLLKTEVLYFKTLLHIQLTNSH